MATLFDVTNILANEMANHWSVDVTDEVRGEDESSIHGHDDVEAATSAGFRNLLAQRRYTRGDSPSGIPRTIARAHGMGPSAITNSSRILSFRGARAFPCADDPAEKTFGTKKGKREKGRWT